MKNIKDKILVSEMLHDWYVVDHILFGGIPKKYLNEQAYSYYLNQKKIYLDTLFEFYKHIGYRSKFVSSPKNKKDLIMESVRTHRSALSKCAKLMSENKKKLSRIISEGLSIDDSNSAKDRFSKLKCSSLFDICFMENTDKFSINPGNKSDEGGIILSNCLTESRKELILLASKYYPYF